MSFRSKPTVKFLKEQQIEAKAEALLARFEAEYGPIEKPPVPVEFVAEDFLGFQITWTTLSDSQTYGHILPDRKEITLNDKLSDYFDSIGPEFTLAHEIAHWELDHFDDVSRQRKLGIKVEMSQLHHNRDNYVRKDSHEFQANYFAGCLLIPKRLLLPRAYQLDLTKKSSIDKLTAQFKVSATVMRIRLEQLRLIYVHEGRIYRDRPEATGNRRLL